MPVLSPSSWHVRSNLCSAPFYQYTSCQLLISCYQNLLAKSSFGCNYSSSSCCDVGAVFENLQSGGSHWLQRELGQLSACKTQKHHLERGKVCGEAVLVQLLLKKQQHLQGMQPSFRFLSWLSSWSWQFRNAGWKEFMPIPCHHFLLSKPQFGNHSETISCTWWGTSCYPVVSLWPCTWDGALNKDLLLPCICWLHYRTMLHYSIKRRLFQQPVWMMYSQAFYRRIGKVWCCELVYWNVCVLIPAVSIGHSQFSLPAYLILFLNLLKQALSVLALLLGPRNISSWLDHSALLHPGSHQHVFFTLSHMFGLTFLSPYKLFLCELLASLSTYFCMRLSRKCMKSTYLKEHHKQVKLYIPNEKS